MKHNKPWIYGGCIGAEGQSMTILPGETACLACLMADAPPPGTTPTCDTAGIIAPIVNVVASIEAAEALKILSGHRDAVSRRLTIIDLWDNQFRHVDLAKLAERRLPRVQAPANTFGLPANAAMRRPCCADATPCNSAPRRARRCRSKDLAARLAGVGRIQQNAFLLRLHVDSYVLTVFPDGRTIVGGTNDVATARTVHARYIGA